MVVNTIKNRGTRSDSIVIGDNQTEKQNQVQIYCCADGTLTYGPLGGSKIISQAIEVCEVANQEEAEKLIGLAASSCYGPAASYGRGRRVSDGCGPASRMRYSFADFYLNDVATLPLIRETLESIRDGQRCDDEQQVRDAIGKTWDAPSRLRALEYRGEGEGNE